jgi:6-phosphogluconolactonase/glucosamine-6-phosphate isomerase/deaminase
MKEFRYSPASWIPFRDIKELERVRNIKREEIEKHHNPEFKIRVVPDEMIGIIWLADMFARIKESDEKDKQLVLILGNPNHNYKKVAHFINRCNVDCRNMYVFIMDEWADEDGNIAPESYPQGFMRAQKNYFYKQIREDLRPPEDHIKGPNNENIDYYGKMIEDMGNADICYSGSGWAGHIAFIDPDIPEFSKDLEEWKQQGPRVVTLHPLTIAQNSLHGSFGASGDIAKVPPKAATIGPEQVIKAKYRIDMNALTVGGSFVSWQRFITRMIAHGPVTPYVPASILQTLQCDFYISETCAANIEPDWDRGY